MSLSYKIISKEKVINDGKLLIELIDFNLLKNTLILREKLIYESGEIIVHKNNYPIILTDDEINNFLEKTNIKFDEKEIKYIQNIKVSLDNILLLLIQDKPPYNLNKNSFEKY